MEPKSMPIVPSLYIQNTREQSANVALRLTRAKKRIVVRLTGGCGNMSASDAEGVYELFSSSFKDFAGAILFGGSRMINREDHLRVVPGITEVAPLIRKQCPDSIILGVVPKSQELRLNNVGLIVADHEENDFVTIVHPDQDICLLVQQSVDVEVSWEAEYKTCLDIISNLREFGGWQSLLVSYNGGSVTEKEILETAERKWPVLLIRGSGRKTDEYAENKDFLACFPNVFVADKDSQSLREHLTRLGAL